MYDATTTAWIGSNPSVFGRWAVAGSRLEQGSKGLSSGNSPTWQFYRNIFPFQTMRSSSSSRYCRSSEATRLRCRRVFQSWAPPISAGLAGRSPVRFAAAMPTRGSPGDRVTRLVVHDAPTIFVVQSMRLAAGSGALLVVLKGRFRC